MIDALQRAHDGVATLEPALEVLRGREARNWQLLDALLELV